ncbi:hypothetical protein [Lederbergia citri]|uniref:DUF4129 domain-containing protein n=1 Tax=Lederbergia citri TaxID=2833580 RepID=A0A942TCI5_9BACI|nr:hypothetical protein [Lederbergia citri]MBS4193792.1 hypothetical protein [Lederbergia citri]
METKEYSSMMSEVYSQGGLIRSFLLKAILVSLIISPIHVMDSYYYTIAWPFLLLVCVGSVILLGLQRMNTKGFSFNFIAFTAPILFLLSVSTQLPFWIFLFSTVFLYFVLSREIENDIYDSVDGGEGILVATVFTAFVIWMIAAIFSLPFLYPVLLLLLVQFLVFSFGTFMRRYFESRIIDKNLLLLKVFVGMMGIFAVAFLAAFLFNHYLRKLLDQLLSLFATFLLFIIEPIIKLFPTSSLNQTEDNANQFIQGNEFGSDDSEIILNLEPSQVANNIVLVISIIILCFIIFYFFKKYKTRRPYQGVQDKTLNPFITKVSTYQDRNNIGPVYSDIENVIRREIKSLDKFAGKRKLGRHSNESFRDWFKRIDINISTDSMNIYESVRYGSVNATSTEVKNFMEEIKTIKEKMVKKE